MAELTDASIPRLAAGCRWGGTAEAPVVLFPEGAIKVEGTGRAILELCAGQLSLAQIVEKLEQQFILVPPGKIRADVVGFIEQLHAKRIIDYEALDHRVIESPKTKDSLPMPQRLNDSMNK